MMPAAALPSLELDRLLPISRSSSRPERPISKDAVEHADQP